jgi:hypothetical protein
MTSPPSVTLPRFAFLTPRTLPPASKIEGRVAVLDIAFASEGGGASFEKTTLPFIKGLGGRLAAWSTTTTTIVTSTTRTIRGSC